jgi:putative oxygen-independent coproporphyrinogen III oxidase
VNILVNAVYIHIPFCKEICHYCDFTKNYYNETIAEQFVQALQKEIKLYIGDNQQKVKTIYIGGGTPTSLSDSHFKKLLTTVNKYFDVANCEEFTVEANPGEFSYEKMQMLKEFGVNRISLGVQVLDDMYLKMLNRNHEVKDVVETVSALQKIGMENISMDFIYALPEQTLEHFQDTLKKAILFNLPHYSAYALQIEPKTVFYLRYKEGKLRKPKEETEVLMYEALVNEMEKAGLKQYEISNFGKPGYESKHNLHYWNNEYYYGFGAGAHGYLPTERIVNLRPVHHYIKSIQNGKKPILHIDPISKKEMMEEEMFLGLRKTEGVSRKRFFDKFHIEMDDLYGKEIEKLEKKGWLMQEDDYIRLTHAGRLFGNEVFSAFLLDESRHF